MGAALRGMGRLRAQAVLEYGLLIATIALVVLLGVGAFGGPLEVWLGVLVGRIVTAGT